MEIDSRLLLNRLDQLSKSEISNIFHGTGEVGGQICFLCTQINKGTEIFLSPQANVDLSDVVYVNFLRSSLPILIEILIRRTTLREHEDYVAQTLIQTSRLLAQPLSQNFLELCDLRNILMTGNIPHFKFITVKQIKSQQIGSQSQALQRSGSGFFLDHGRPETAISDTKVVTFWPDEWRKVLNGERAIGNYVQIYIIPKDQSSCGVWRKGRVSEYFVNEDMHRIVLDPKGDVSVSDSALEGDIGSAATASNTVGAVSTNVVAANTAGSSVRQAVVWESKDVVKVSFDDCKHIWYDNGQRLKNASGKKIPSVHNQALLDYSSKDVGEFCRVWWSRYQRFFYGRIVSYNVASKEHQITYEDGDTRTYDMSSKIYELIVLPTSFSITGAKDDADCAHMVSSWHARVLAKSREVESVVPESPAKIPSQGQCLDPYDLEAATVRPLASLAQGASIHHFAVINAYFAEGGGTSMFRSLSDPVRPAPLCTIIASHLQLIYQLRKVLRRSLVNNLVWEAKEGVPFAFSRYGDAQFKEFSRGHFEEVTGVLRELVMSTTTNVHGLDESLEYLRLSVSAKLLTCSQLQKRYFGLSMLREAIEVAMPSAASFVKKRSAFLSSGVRGSTFEEPPRERDRERAPVLSSEALESWILNNKVFEEIVGESIHQDLVSKSSIILVFLGHRRALTESHIDALWLATKKAHEAVVRVLHQMILLIVPVLEPYLRMHLFTLISAVPYKDYTEQILHLIKSYTLHALAAFREDSVATVRHSPSDSIEDSDACSQSLTGGSMSLASTTKSSVNGRPGTAVSGSDRVASVSRKGMVVSAPQRQWLGFGVLWQFIQDPTVSSGSGGEGGVDEGLIDLATQLLVDLLEEEFKDERELILQRCLDNIQMGMSVPVSLRLLRKTLATYPLPSRSWFKGAAAKLPTICSQIEKLQRLHRMLDIVFADLASYHSALVNQSTAHMLPVSDALVLGSRDGSAPSDSAMQNIPSLSAPVPMKRNRSADFSLNDKRIQIKGKVGRMSHLKGVIERLDFLQFVLSRSSLTISFAQLQLLWRALGEEAVTNETLDQLVYWVDSMVTKENKTFTSFLTALAQETDPKDPSSPSKLACLGPSTLPPFSSSMDYGGAVSQGEETSSAFEEGILVKLFEGNILPWVTRREKTELLNRVPLAILCLKLFLLVNVSNKSLKVEADGSWVRVGQLSGMAVLWRMAVCCSDTLVHEAAISLLVEVHHRIPQNKFKNSDAIRGHILRISFRQLSVAMQSLRAGETDRLTDRTPDRIDSPPPERAGFNNKGGSSSERFGLSGPLGEAEIFPVLAPIPRDRDGDFPTSALATLSTGCGPSDEWFDDGDVLADPKAIARVVARLIMVLLLYIQRFDQHPTQLITLQILAGRDDSPVLTLTLRSTETVGVLRDRVANHFKEPSEAISLLKPGRSSQLLSGTFLGGGQERLEKNDITLRQAKFLPHDSVIARKKDVPPPTGFPGRNPTDKSGPLTEDLITFKDLSGDLLAVLQPLQWLATGVGEVETPLTGGSSQSPHTPGLETPKLSSTALVASTFQLPPFPLPSKGDMTLIPLGDTNQDRNMLGMSSVSAPTHTAAQTQHMGTGDVTAPAPGRLSDCLIPLLRQSPQHMDQLLSMLDGYLSTEIQGAAGVTFDLSAAVWEVLQSLPTHPTLLKQVRDMPYERTGGSIRVLLNLNSPYRLLYVLQMVDSFLAEADERGLGYAHAPQVSEWALQFLHIGGAEHIVQLIESAIKLLQLMKRDTSDTADAQRDRDRDRERERDRGQNEKKAPQKADSDVTVLILALLYRTLHRLLLVDPMYNRWQVNSVFGSKDPTRPPTESTFEFPPKARALPPKGVKDPMEGGKTPKAPPGLVLTCINTPPFVKAALDCVYKSATQGSGSGPGSAPLQALAENALVVVMGLLAACDDGVQVLLGATSGGGAGSNGPVHGGASTPDVAGRDGQDGVLKCRGSEDKQDVQDSDPTYSEIPSLKAWMRSLCLTHRDRNVRRGVCQCIFKVFANLFYLAADPSVCADEKRQKMLLFECVFHAVVSTAHTGYDIARAADHAVPAVTGLPPRPPGTRTPCPSSPAPCTPMQAEQIYSLLASLLALRGIPRLIFPPNPETPQNYTPHMLASSPLESYTRDAEILSELFATQLMSHRSLESFHSSQPDGALVGILRVLLVLSTGHPMQKRKLGNFRRRSSSEATQCIALRGSHTEKGNGCVENGEDLLSFLYLNCLFPKDKDRVASTAGEIELDALGALCQTAVSREIAYALIYQLCKSDQSNLARLVCIMNGATEGGKVRGGRGKAMGGKRAVQWEYDPSDLIKEEGSFVGLVNQGGTCYMNSLLQQLYHIPAFSTGLLSITNDSQDSGVKALPSGNGTDGIEERDKEKEKKGVRSEENGTAKEDVAVSAHPAPSSSSSSALAVKPPSDDEKLLFQLQVMFGYLRLSEKRFYDTMSFCKAFTDYDGSPINLVEQKDINEFAGMLFDKLESNKECSALLSRTIKGKILWRTRSIETPYKSDREESFFMVTAEVKDKATLEDSLELFVGEELFSGDNKLEDPDAGRKVEALRRCTFRELPPTLIIHLKRFEFNIETMDRKKVNDQLTFPMDLNMFPYTEEGIAAKENKRFEKQLSQDDAEGGRSGSLKPDYYYQYTLKGIVAHIGAIDRGHYYSFIKERSSDKWLEFNDRTVLPFSAEAIPVECFGGEESAQTALGAKRMRQNSAYLLLYERKQPTQEEREQGVQDRHVDGESDVKAVSSSVSNAVGALSEEQNKDRLKEKVQRVSESRKGSLFSEDEKASEEEKVSKENEAKTFRGYGGVRDSFSNDSWDEKEASQEREGEREAEREEKTEVAEEVQRGAPQGVWDEDKDGSRAGDKDRDRDRDRAHLPIAKKVLQAVWTENLEFQTDRSLFNRIHFNFLWQLQRCSVVVDMLKKKTKTLEGNSALPSSSSQPPYSSLAHPDDAAGHEDTQIIAHTAVDPPSDLSVQTDGTDTAQTEETLAQLSLTCLRFNIEVLARARASGCVHSFFEHLEEMVIYDMGRGCARALLKELVTDTHTHWGGGEGPASGDTQVWNHSHPKPPTRMGPGVGVGTGKERAHWVQSYHPWLVSIFLSCPHELTVKAFCRFLLTCVKVLRPTEKAHYLDPTPHHPPHAKKTENDPDKGVKKISAADSGISADTVSEVNPMYGESCKYGSYVTRLMDKLLSVFERISAEEVASRDGCRLLSSLFMQTACLGVEEKAMLLKIGTVRRVIRSVVAMNPSVTQASPDELYFSTDLVALLVRSSIVPPTDLKIRPTDAASIPTVRTPGPSPFLLAEIAALSPETLAERRSDLTLSAEDLQAFLNRDYLEESINISTTQTAAALQHLCWSRSAAETGRILAFLGDRVSDCVMCVTGVDLAYRTYFRIMSELLLSAAVECISAFDSVLPALLLRAEAIVCRQCPTDSEFLYAVLKLLHRIGTRSSDGHQCVQRVRDQWRFILYKWDKMKRTQSYRGGAAGRMPVATAMAQPDPSYPASMAPSTGGYQNTSFMLG